MMKRVAYIILMTVAFASCNRSDEGLGPSVEALCEIILAPTVNTMESTKGAIIEDSEDLQSTTFMLYATAYDNATLADYAVAKAEVEYTSALGWSPEDGSKIYWPTSESDVTFYAWYPASVEPKYISEANLYFACDTKAASTPSSGEITLYKDATSGDVVHYYNNAAAVQDDLMCSTTVMTNPTQQSVQGESEIDYTVDLDFVHALTHLKFEYKTVSGLEVRIKAMTLHNIISKGGFYSYSSGKYEWAASYGDYYEDTRPNYQSVPMAWGNEDFIAATHTAVAINGENDLMVFPQGVTAWVPNDGTYTYSIENNDAETGAKRSYLRIYCDIEATDGTDKHGDYKTNSDSDTVTIDPDNCIYVPISSKDNNGVEVWKAGNIVTYTLTFGTGYSEDGIANSDEITSDGIVSVEVTATLNKWNDGGDYNVEF